MPKNQNFGIKSQKSPIAQTPV